MPLYTPIILYPPTLYRAKNYTDVYFTVKNLFDDEYIVDRTRGILPGAPRLFQAGLKQNF